jgi:hypothetical protein
VTASEIAKVHQYYSRMKGKWDFWIAAYEGIEALLDWGVLEKHERESDTNFKQRKKEAYGFDYAPAVIDLFNFYLFEKEHEERELADLPKDELWNLFEDDCDLEDTDFGQWLIEQQKFSSVFGHVGILIDKPSASFQTRAEQLQEKVYPYVTVYYPQNILDYEFQRNETTGRPELIYLKLRDEDGRYRLWWRDRWEVWEEKKTETNTSAQAKVPKAGQEEVPIMGKLEKVSEGTNPLGEIPFVWLYNVKGRIRGIGDSDIKTVARIDASIVRNLSHGEEVIKYAAFPMLRMPKEAVMPGEAGEQAKEVRVGERAVLDFDPENGGEAKPDWLESKVKEPVDAILAWIAKKVVEIYRSVNAGGLHTTEVSTQAKSGAALRQEFQLLNAQLVAKASSLEEAERSIIYFWCRWESKDDTYKKVVIKRPRDFSVEDLAADLENALSAKTLITSPKFRKQLMKSMVALVLPGISQKSLQEIYDDIDKLPEEAPPALPTPPDPDEVNRPSGEEGD